MFADGQSHLDAIGSSGNLFSGGANSNTVSTGFDWQQFSQNVIASLENGQQYQTTSTAQAFNQSMINTFRNFQSNLG